jgi:hypothetical protein
LGKGFESSEKETPFIYVMKCEKGGMDLDFTLRKKHFTSEIFSLLQAVLVLISRLSQNILHSYQWLTEGGGLGVQPTTTRLTQPLCMSLSGYHVILSGGTVI